MAKIVFMGTPDFAVPALQTLIDAGHEIKLLLCQPDRRKGRGQKVQFPPTKELAIRHDIPVYQPGKLRSPEVQERLAAKAADFFVVIAYGKILPTSILSIPKYGCINVHASLLPQWRGAAPIQFSLLNGDLETGVCTMLMDKGMDTGDILLCEKTQIAGDELSDQLTNRLSLLGANLVQRTIETFPSITPIPQDHSQATYARLIDRQDRRIEWEKEATVLYNQYRALSPQPGVYTEFRGKRLLLNQVRLTENGNSDGKPGEIIQTDQGILTVATGKGALEILRCQPENKREMSTKDLINGFQVRPGETLGF